MPLLFGGESTAPALKTAEVLNPSPPPAIRPREFPLSRQQLRVWLAEQVDAGTPARNVCRALTLKGPLDHAALEAALARLVRRHEVLRTTYRLKQSPVQEFLPAATFPLPRHDLTHLGPSERRRVASNLLALDAARPFNLATGPLLRAKLIRLDHQEYVLALMFHQIVIDARSIEIFFTDLAATYAALAAGLPDPLPPLRVQYADLALRDAAASSDWKNRLVGEVARLSTSREPAKAAVSGQGLVQNLKLDRPLAEKLRAFSIAARVPFELPLLATFQLLLHHWTGEADVCVGSCEPGRADADARELVGCFADVLALRTRVSPEENFRQCVARVQQTWHDAAVRGERSLEKLFLGTDAPGGSAPCFQAWFERIDSLEPFQLGDVRATPKAIFPAAAQFDLALFVTEQNGEVLCFLEHKTSVVTAAQASQMLDQFDRLLEQFLETPAAPVRDFLAALDG